MRTTNVRGAALLACCVLVSACGGGHKATAAGSPLRVPESPRIPAGARFSVELQPSGRVFAWGHNATGELGDGTIQMRTTPVEVRGLPPGGRVVAVAAGSNHVLALESDGTVWAWGHNRSGQLGDGTKNDQPVPVRVKGLHDVRAIGAGDAFSMALKSDGTVLAWGKNKVGELGDGTTADKSMPLVVTRLGPGSGVVAIAAGSFHAIALKRDGGLAAWGNNSSGQLGDGTAPKNALTPAVVKGIEK